MDQKVHISIPKTSKDDFELKKSSNIYQLCDQKAEHFNEIKSKKGSFSMKGKSFFLTYPRSPNGWTKELVRDYLLKRVSYCYERKDDVSVPQVGKTKIRKLIVSKEKHTEEGRTQDYDRGEIHYHCYLETFEKVSINNVSYFDIPSELTEDVLRYSVKGRVVQEKVVMVGGSAITNELQYIHGDYQLAKNIMVVVNYVKKEGDYIEYGS